MQKLWILFPREGLSKEDNPWKPWYDKVFGVVVHAETEEEARRLANEEGGDETGPRRNVHYQTGGDPWLDAHYSTCEELSLEGPSEVIMTDFRSA